METKLVLNIKNFFTLGLFLFLYFNFGNQGLGHDKNLDLPANKIFGKFKTPTKEDSEPIGFYSRGCLSGAEKLDDTGEYWQIMRPARNRNWGHPETIQFTKDLSKKASCGNVKMRKHITRHFLPIAKYYGSICPPHWMSPLSNSFAKFTKWQVTDRGPKPAGF